MKIVRETSDQLIVKTQSFLPFFLTGLIFSLVGIGVTFDLFQRPAPVWVGILFFGVGLLPIFFAKQVKVVFDKGSNRLLICRRGISGKSIEDYDLSEVKKVVVKQTFNDNSQSGSGIRFSSGIFFYYIIIVLTNNMELFLEGRSNSLFKARKIVEKISIFLGTPSEYDNVNTA